LTDLRNWPGIKKNGVQFATGGWQHLNSNILMWQQQSGRADTNSPTNHIQRQRGRDPPVQYAAVFAPQPLD